MKTPIGWLLALTLAAGSSLGQELRITGFAIGLDGKPRFEHPAGNGSYYILYRGDTVTTIAQANDMALGQSTVGQLVDSSPINANASAFYRIRQVPLAQPLDSDHFGGCGRREDCGSGAAVREHWHDQSTERRRSSHQPIGYS